MTGAVLKKIITDNKKENILNIQLDSGMILYVSHMNDLQFDDSNQLMTFTDTQSKLKYFIDYDNIMVVRVQTEESKKLNLGYYAV